MLSVDASSARRQTERIVSSRIFAKAKRSQRLLRYLVDAALADPPQMAKEYTIATEVFDRDASYDPAVDATVRVEAGRLRTRLREYYAEEGKEDGLLIEVPKGADRVVLTEQGCPNEQAVEQHGASSASGAQSGLLVPSLPAVSTADSLAAPFGQPLWRRFPESQGWRFATPVLASFIILAVAAWKPAKPQLAHPIIRSVAVLPLKNLSGDPGQDFFADGTTDELITQLARVSGLRVVSWNSVLQEKDTKKPLKAIAAELQADLLVEGSVSRSGDTVRITAQLIDAENDDHVWAGSFQGRLDEVMVLEQKAAEEIVEHAQTGRSISESGPSAQRATANNPAAHDALLRGKYFFDKRQARVSADYFQHAIDLSPTYASAYSGLAAALESEALLGDARPEEVIPEALSAVQRALELAPSNGDALIARGSIETAFMWTWKAAESDLTRGVALTPNNSYGHMMLSVYLDSVGKPDDALKQMQEAVEIDPLSFYMARHYGSALFYARRYDEALIQLKYARAMHPEASGVVDHWISEVYAKKGMYDEAVRYDLLELQDVHPSEDLQKLLNAYRSNGWQGYWATRLHVLKGNSNDPLYNYEVGLDAMRAGHHEQAIIALKRATIQHCYWMGVARSNPLFDDLRGEPGSKPSLLSCISQFRDHKNSSLHTLDPVASAWLKIDWNRIHYCSSRGMC